MAAEGGKNHEDQRQEKTRAKNEQYNHRNVICPASSGTE
jgi:hypothetical protein